MQRDSETLGARPNGRPPTQLFVNHQDRKPLFSSTNSRGDENAKEPDSRRASLIGRPADRSMSGGDTSLASIRRKSTSEAQSVLSSRRDSNVSIVSSSGTRIPRLNSLSLARRRPMTLAEAWKLAQGEEGGMSDDGEAGLDHIHPVDGSPSPAPRPWRSRTASDESKLRRILGEDHLDTEGQNKPQSARNSISSGTLVASKETATGNSTTKSPAVSRPLGGGRGIVRMASNESLSRNRPSDWKSPSVRSSARLSRFGGSRETLNGGDSGIPDLVPGIEDMTRPSIERPSATPKIPSPEKSFAWQVDEDFTAGDLQVSDSPRIKIGTRPFANRLLYGENGKLNLDSIPRLTNPGSRNTKLDEIRSRELQAGSNLPVLDRSRPRPQNTKLDEIRARESQVEHQIPIPSRHLERLRNTKLDEIRQREADGLSRRAFAAARLEEIREQNSMSRPRSPEESRPQSSRGLTRQPPKPDPIQESTTLPARPKTAFDGDAGRRIPDTPVTIFKRDPRFAMAAHNSDKADVEEHEKEDDDDDAQLGPDYRRIDEQDLLRRLARAASSSPAVAETKAQKPPTAPPPGNQNIKTTQNNSDRSEPDTLSSRRASDNARKTTSGIIKDSEKSKPVVGFVGLQRTRSTDSTKSKRSSMQSETDPTDRIEAEMKLFAPMDNHSERGSIRAPSPPPDSDEEKEEDRTADATPKPTKPDPLTMPTPRVTGAYVETPATVKVEKIEVLDEPKPEPEAKPKVEEKPVKPEPPAPILRDRRASLAWRNKDQDTASDPGAADESDVGITTSAAVKRPRAKSLPRRRPPVKNSAKPPSVKDDILELQRVYNIEDSTYEDLDEVLLGRRAALIKNLPSFSKQLDFEIDFDLKPKPDLATVAKKEKEDSEPEPSDPELAAYNRMSKSLRTGLSSIRSAKQGIERLEGHFSQVEKPQLQSKPAAGTTSSDSLKEHGHHNHRNPEKGCPHCTSRPSPLLIAYLHLPIPRLYHTKPKFRFSLLGLVLFILSLWCAAESTMCSMYCRPTTCAASKSPCVWSFDDPTTFGTAIPIKLDQWITGGYGREFFSHAVEEAHDWVADMQDLALGRNPMDMDMEKMSFEQKRQHRRRLRKKGLAKPAKVPTPEEKAKWDAWHQTRLAKQRAKEAREMGYAVDDYAEGAVGGDQRIG